MTKTIVFFALVISLNMIVSILVSAQPYGAGKYGIDVPYGSQTSLSISTNGDVSIGITPTEFGAQATGTNQVTVTSTDVVGYKLYIRALNDTNMNNLGALLPASANIVPATLTTNTWGYNTDGSNNFIGITNSDVLIKSTAQPVKNGETTTITYGIKLDMGKPAGKYAASVIYTATPQTD
jgi:hypothetical protein